ncbi:four-carbon acid sugar kinase family protein [Ruania rhizosphaerae]|uniref:four-carbon acid sugar kinase family protein n=1 Tax=Ruania rhizosphaerae TaxID=1840413 RepID=UPI001358932E|nr:four-carbon acid sugar kinase family protein [Ruania rhizosphaerae]
MLELDERLIVIDDDPTGSQAVHGVQVVGRFDEPTITAALTASQTVFLLSNARALPEHAAVARLAQIASTVRQVCHALGLQARFASRSDSTLRGHFPADVRAIAGAGPLPTVLLVPCFVDGGRWTFDDVHWVREGQSLVPVGQTPYARDDSFGFHSSRLPEWVAEKSGGQILAEDVISLPLQQVRTGGPEALATMLAGAAGSVVVANAVDDGDLEVIADAVRIVEREGQEVLYRTGASFVRARAGISRREPVTVADLGLTRRGRGGLVVCGSHVPLSTAQLTTLLQREDCVGIELDVPEVVARGERAAVAQREAAGRIVAAVRAGRHAVVYTSREVVPPAPGQGALELGEIVSGALVELVRRVRSEPDFLVTKGGITSHEVATRALELERGTVLGQVVPGVSAWRVDTGGAGSQVLVVFPGNVGDERSLADVVGALSVPEQH